MWCEVCGEVNSCTQSDGASPGSRSNTLLPIYIIKQFDIWEKLPCAAFKTIPVLNTFYLSDLIGTNLSGLVFILFLKQDVSDVNQKKTVLCFLQTMHIFS